jgi:two-component SAPR family response regulator
MQQKTFSKLNVKQRLFSQTKAYQFIASKHIRNVKENSSGTRNIKSTDLNLYRGMQSSRNIGVKVQVNLDILCIPFFFFFGRTGV